MEPKRKRGRPPKHGEAMTGAERTRRWRESRKLWKQEQTGGPEHYWLNRLLEEARLERSRLVDWQKQEIKWLHDYKKHRKEIEKTVARHPKVMKEYLTAAIAHRTHLKLAIESAKRGMFSSESIAFVTKTHAEITELMDSLQAAIDANPR